MATLLSFTPRKPLERARRKQVASDAAIIIFPGVRYQLEAEDAASGRTDGEAGPAHEPVEPHH